MGPILKRLFSAAHAPMLTFDKIEVFSVKSGMHIIHLSTSHEPESFLALTEAVRERMKAVGCVIQSDFMLHVTLGRLRDFNIKQSKLKRMASSFSFIPFTLALTNVDYRVFRGKVLYETLIQGSVRGQFFTRIGKDSYSSFTKKSLRPFEIKALSMQLICGLMIFFIMMKPPPFLLKEMRRCKRNVNQNNVIGAQLDLKIQFTNKTLDNSQQLPPWDKPLRMVRRLSKQEPQDSLQPVQQLRNARKYQNASSLSLTYIAVVRPSFDIYVQN